MKKTTHTEIFAENPEKKKYISPTLEVMILEMECGISVSSAIVAPVNTFNQIQEDWAEGEDETHDVNW